MVRGFLAQALSVGLAIIRNMFGVGLGGIRPPKKTSGSPSSGISKDIKGHQRCMGLIKSIVKTDGC